MHLNSRAGRTQRGNILFLILLAVVLFAALSYAVTSAMRGGGKDASRDSYRLAAGAYVQYFGIIDTAIMRLNLSQGLQIEDIIFRHDSYHFGNSINLVNYMNNTRCSSDACRIFSPSGGNIPSPLDIYRKYMGAAGHTWTTGTPIVLINWPGAGTSKNDIAMVFPLMKAGVCREINAENNIQTPPQRTSGGDLANNPATWDSGTPVQLNTNSALMGIDTFAANYTSSSADTAYCDIYHLVMSR